MKTVAIITEYNPFHNGHEYQLQRIKELTDADCIIAIMSGNFVQRGEPAIYDMHVRANLAIECGCDLIIELPVSYSTGSAEYFAKGAVSILNSLGNIDYLAFGMENDNIDELIDIATLLAKEPDDFKEELNRNLCEGKSFPNARQIAIKKFINLVDDNTIMSPNNILAIEYIKALINSDSAIKPLGIKRIGAGYNSPIANNNYNNATNIRMLIHENADASVLTEYMPQASVDAVLASLPLYVDDFWELISYAILSNESSLECFSDVSLNLANSIRYLISKGLPSSYNEMVATLTNKTYPSSRIKRALLHILLNIRSYSMDFNDFYARILAFNKIGQSYLNSIKKITNIPIITNPKNASSQLSSNAYKIFMQDIYATEIYNIVYNKKSGTRPSNEFRRKIF